MVEKSHAKTHAEESFHSLLDTVFVGKMCSALWENVNLPYTFLHFRPLQYHPEGNVEGRALVKGKKLENRGNMALNAYPHRNQHTDTHCMAVEWINPQQQQASRH